MTIDKTKSVNIKIQRESLLKALRFVQKIVPNNPQLPILSSLLLKLDKGKLSLSSTDLYFGIQSRVVTTTLEKLSIAIPGHVFKDMVNSLKSETLEIILEKDRMKMKANGSIVSIPIQDPKDYPEFPEIVTKKMELSKEVMARIEKFVCFAAGVDQARPILTTLLIKLTKKGLTAVATDGFRLAVLDLPEVKGKEEDEEILIPSRYFSEVFKIAEQSDIEKITIYSEEELKQLRFEVGESDIYVRLIEGEYPPYEKIIPETFSVSIVFDGERFSQELKRAAILAKEASNIVTIKSEEISSTENQKKGNTNSSSQIIIESNSLSKGSYTGKLPLLSSINESIEISFNVNYLLDFLSSCKPGVVEMKFNDSLKPAMFSIDERDNFRYIVMPFRVNQ